MSVLKTSVPNFCDILRRVTNIEFEDDMRIELASSYGFCYGVKRAINIAENMKIV